MTAAIDGAAVLRRLTTPRSAAVAGILFALLFGCSLVLLRLAVPADPFAETRWVGDATTQMRVAIGLMPFAGIAFLWFVGVIRDRLGDYEDRFFSTVFLGSGLVFLAMVFVAMAIGGAIVAGAAGDGTLAHEAEVVHFGRAVMLQISNVYALRMAGVFMVSLATIWLRTGLMPRWLAFISYVLALVLLTVVDRNLWVTLVFPAWALTVSVLLLVSRPRPAG